MAAQPKGASRRLPWGPAGCTLPLAYDSAAPPRGRALEIMRGAEMQVRWGLPVHSSVGVVAIFGFVASSLGLGCASSRVSDLDAYHEIPMHRVVPFPSEAELRKRAFGIVVVDRPSEGIDDAVLEVPRAQLRRGLEGIAADVGASIIDRSQRDSGGRGIDGVEAESDVPEAEGADYVLATHFSTYRNSSTWTKPTKLPWQSPDDIAVKPGTCHHRVEVELEIQVIEAATKERLEETFAIAHTALQKNKDLDSACSISPVTLSVLFETVLDDALSCLQLPLGRLLSPRGHVSSHRKAPEAERHIYRVSLGSDQGLEHGDSVEIRREQLSMSPDGEEARHERVISLGRVTDQISAQMSWVAIDPAKATDEILEGDVVRPIEKESLLASLSGPSCGSILDVR